MPDERQPWRCRYTDGETDQTAPCWVASEAGPRLAIARVGGCLARTLEEAQWCAEETADAADPNPGAAPPRP